MDKPERNLLKFCMPTENSILNLQNGVIFCQHFSAYNDPFEFWNHIQEGIPDAVNEPKRFAAALRAWGMEGSLPEDEDVISYFDECQLYQPPFKEMRDSVRIACFASQCENMLMWSHYGDGLRGFCIVFDEESVTMAEPEAYVLNVEYREAPPVVDSFVYAIAHDQDWYHQVAIEETEARIRYSKKTDEAHWIPIYERAGADAVAQMRKIWQQVFAVKPSDWAYERERRIIIHTQRTDTKPIQRSYPSSAVKEIILGERMPDDYRDRIFTVLREKHPSVPIKTARRAEGCYGILIE